jgi:hypothetical protein
LGKSVHSARTAATLSTPGFIVTTRKIAARVKGATTVCGAGGVGLVAAIAVVELASGIAIFVRHRTADFQR